MSTKTKPIKVWGEKGGPNPPKVLILLEELGVPHELVHTALSESKNPEYIAINPNGRLPAIHDPNTGLTLWESGAIFEYLIENYDKGHRFSFVSGSPEAWHAKQWLYFQTTGQGPYYGQAAWFKKFHPEKVPAAIERYVKEVNRVSRVLDDYLTQQKKANSTGDGPWLVGNKISFADISFITWQRAIGFMLEKQEYNVDEYPQVKEWLEKMLVRRAAKAVLA